MKAIRGPSWGVVFAAGTWLMACGSGMPPLAPDSGLGTDAGNQQDAGPQLIHLTSGQAASLVLGQPNLMTGTPPSAPTAATFNTGYTLAATQDALFVPDFGGGRVLSFPLPLDNGENATVALGVMGLTVPGDAGVTASDFGSNMSPSSVASDGTRVFVYDDANARVLVYNHAPTATHAAADAVVGAPDLVSSTPGCSSATLNLANGPVNANGFGVSTAGGKLMIADTAGNRVLIWNSIPSISGSPADLVLGQPNFTTCTVNSGGSAATGATMASPQVVWSDGERLVVVDSMNNRVLIWKTFPTQNGQSADLVLGQPNLTSSTTAAGPTGMNCPGGVDSNGVQLFVADSTNNRVLVWNSFPTASGQPADVVLGQSDFMSTMANQGGAVGPSTLGNPFGVFVGLGRLAVLDQTNARVVLY